MIWNPLVVENYIDIFSWDETLKLWRRYVRDGQAVQKEWAKLLVARVERGRAPNPLPDDVVQLLMEVAANNDQIVTQ